MKKEIITLIEQEMLEVLNNEQLEYLHNVLKYAFKDKNISFTNLQDKKEVEMSNLDFLDSFLSAKQVEGCSQKSLKYYRTTLIRLFGNIDKSIKQVVTDDIRKYLADYELNSKASKITIDNIRRIISTFFSWLEDENYIIKSPARRIHKIRTGQTVKETYSDEDLERMRDSCDNMRDLAIIDILSSTGMRVGELVNLNISDMDFKNRECVVLGKGNKQRKVYFDARTKLHLLEYLQVRKDDDNALFVSLNKPYQRLSINAVEVRLRNLGKKLKIIKVHPHKFRRTLATKAIDKGMPIEQVQILLGHTKIDTTLQYAMVNQNNVKLSHQKYIG